MAIVMISSTSKEGREELASSLAAKTGWRVLTREDLVDRAREYGIRVGRLEMSIIKKPAPPERLGREKDLYLSFLTAAICDSADSGNLIYCGRAGHLLLPGVDHRVRVGLTIPIEARTQQAAASLKLSPDKARRYLDQLEQDIEAWVRFIHRVDLKEPGQYDLVLNLEHMGMGNAASILCETAGLTDFRPTPVSLRRLDDQRLSAKAKLRLALDPRTEAADLQVRADHGVVTVTYPPRQESFAESIPDVLSSLDGCRKIQCTMAETSILWLQERFRPDSDSYRRITALAQRWGAAVELVRLVGSGGAGDAAGGGVPPAAAAPAPPVRRDARDGGVEDDELVPVGDDGGLARTQEELVGIGRSGGQRTVSGGRSEIVTSLEERGNYSLVVVGDVFIDKGHAAQTRMTRELALSIRDRLKAPVITAEELRSRFTFGRRQAARLAGFTALVVLAFIAVFSHQAAVLDFLGGPLHERLPWLAPMAVVLFVPLLAYAYGNVAELTLRLLKID